MNKNDVVTVVAVTGAEYIGKFVEETAQTYVIKDPYIVTPDGANIGFMPTVAMTGAPEIPRVEFQKTGVITIVPTADAMVKEYTKTSSGIVLQ